jgi:membrane protease YdiL (CAAX protease family)
LRKPWRISRLNPVLGFIALIAAFWLVALRFGVISQVGNLPTAIASFALLLAPYWFFGFGLIPRFESRALRVLAPLGLLAAWLVFVLPRDEFRWDQFLGMAAVMVATMLLLDNAKPGSPDWHDWLTLAIFGVAVEFHFFDRAWPIAGLTGLAKLLFVDVGLYGYLVVRPIGGIGFDFRGRLSDLMVGLREFAFYTPIALALGFALNFLHFHRTWGSLAGFAAGWLFTLFFVALPEELFFRGFLLNMLERRIGQRNAPLVSSAIFGLAHFNKRAVHFNWRYVILAAIAGVFYSRAWLANRRLLASSITHATVDTVWSIWLR